MAGNDNVECQSLVLSIENDSKKATIARKMNLNKHFSASETKRFHRCLELDGLASMLALPDAGRAIPHSSY